MDGLTEKYPDLVSVQTYGRSSEGRAMKVMKISKPSSIRNETKKPAVWIDGGKKTAKLQICFNNLYFLFILLSYFFG